LSKEGRRFAWSNRTEFPLMRVIKEKRDR